MVIFLAAIGVGLVIGLVRGGRFRHLARLRLRWLPLGITGLLGVVVASAGPLERPELVLAASLAACTVACLANRRLRGLGVVAVGLTANLLPLLVNGVVPVDGDALVHAGVVERAELDAVELSGGRAVADDETTLAVLGDVIPLPEMSTVISFGDLVVAFGLAAAARDSLRHRRAGGVPAAVILAADREPAEVIDLTVPERRRRQHPVEVAPGEPVPIPMGWGHDPVADDDRLVGAGTGAVASGRSGGPPTHVPWPWRRTPPPRPRTHPTMRVRHH